MKLKTVVISVVVTAGICGAAGYGAWYVMQSQKSPVEVVPVLNVNASFWGDENDTTIYGSVTSQVAQTVMLDDEYNIAEIYVDAGDTVKEGDPLFAYDMTMQELELEMEELSLQTQELTLTRLNKDLEKYKNGKVNPSLDDNEDEYTMSADDDEVLEILDEDETEKESESETETEEIEDGGIVVIEKMEEELSDEEKEQKMLLDSVQTFETYVNELALLIDQHKENLKSSEIKESIEKANKYYHNHIVTEKTLEEGETGTSTTYVIMEDIRELLDETDLGILERYIQQFEGYQEFYKELLEKEADNSEGNQQEDDQQEDDQQGDDQQGNDQQGDNQKQTNTETEIQPVVNEKLETYIKTFLEFYKELSSETASNEKDYAERVDSAVQYYQTWLAVPAAAEDENAMDGSQNSGMGRYVLRQEVAEYLLTSPLGAEITGQVLEDNYERLCKSYVNNLIKKLDVNALVQADLNKAIEAYQGLGEVWQKDLETDWSFSHKVVQDGTEITVVDSLADTLQAYRIMALYQEYKKLDEETDEAQKYETLQKIMSAFNELTDEQKSIIQSDSTFEETMRENNLWEPETEMETEMNIPQIPSDNIGGSGDFGGFDDYDDEGYSASELKELIEEKEREIKDCELGIREMKITVGQKQRVVDGKVVKSKMDGTVISIGTIDGDSDNDYFAKVANEDGLYAKGVMSELALEKIKIGDTIAGMMTDSGMSFTAVIKEISDYPDSNGSSMSYGSGNNNASYYPFYALLDNTTGIEEGEAEIQLSGSYSSGSNIYLEKYFVRTGNDGKPYVFIKAEDGTLKKQYVVTGKTLYSYAIEILSGLTVEDCIAFPYGKDVVEGAPTREVDMLENI